MFQSPKYYWKQCYADITYLNRIIVYSVGKFYTQTGISLQIIYLFEIS